MIRILLADDEPSVLSALKLLLEQEPDVKVAGEVKDAESLQQWFALTSVDMVLLDWKLPGKAPLDLIGFLHTTSPSLLVIAMDSSPQTRREAIAAGADNFVSKVEPSEQLLAVLEATRRILNNTRVAPQAENTRRGRHLNHGQFTCVRVNAAVKVIVSYSDVHDIILSDPDFDRVKIEKNGDTLVVSRRGFDLFFHSGGNPEVRIMMPELRKLNIAGAAQGRIEDFHSAQSLVVEVSGASTLELKNTLAGDARFKITGASHATGTLSTGDLDLEISGASWAVLTGSGKNLRVTINGASHAQLEAFPVEAAKAEITGASHGSINTNGRLDARIHGASHLFWAGNPVMGDIDVSGASHIQRR